jgi:hypothetical protein
MKRDILFALAFSIAHPAQGEYVIPPEIANGMVQSSIGEDGGLHIQGVEEEIFISYIKRNWKSIVENAESLPLHAHENKLRGKISLTSLSIVGSACENLPPLEYLDYLDKMLILFEQRKIDPLALELVLGREKKIDFLSVNWEHPRVRTILSKIIELVPPSNVDLLSCVRDMADGKLADNYRTNVSDDVPNPETLPGIKLVRPWDSLLKKYERMTGKKLEEPHDPQFNPRPEKRNSLSGPASPAAADTSPSPMSNPPRWGIFGVLILAVALGWKLIRMRSGGVGLK